MAFSAISILLGKLSDSRRRIWLSAAIATVLFGLFGFAADSAMTRFNIADDVHAGMMGAVVGLGAGLSFLILLAGVGERRRLLVDEFHRLAELNHTVRNSLEAITFATRIPDEQHRAIVLESTARIDEKLRELFPVVGVRVRAPKK